MTVMIRRGSLALFVIVCLAVCAGSAALAYAAVHQAGGAQTPAAVKLLAERVLFAGIIGAAVVILAGAVLLVRSVQLTAHLDKLVTMNRMTGFAPEAALKRLGDVGQRIASIYSHMSELSEKKSRKISSLTALNELLLDMSGQMILVIDAAGRVLQVSRPLLERIDRQRTEVVGVGVDELLPGIRIEAAIREASQTRSSVVRERRGDSLVLNPVINRDGEVSYLVALLTRSVTDAMKQVALSARPQRQASTRAGFLRRLLRRD